VRFLDNAGRLAHRGELIPFLEKIFQEMDLADIDARLRTANIPCSPMRRPDQLADEEHLNVSGQLVETRLSNGRLAKLPKLPIRATGFDLDARRDAPVLGSDTESILNELGYSGKEIQRLVDSKAILITHPQVNPLIQDTVGTS
ncbi:MAG TPA: CoA transferase, partial [Eoetvoesiella sp.]